MHDWLDEIRDWLDTETKAILYPDRPDKLIASATDSFSLLLLHKGKDEGRIREVALAIRKFSPPVSNYPFVVGQGMELEDVLAGQFALACCDCVTAFVRDEIVDESASMTFQNLYNEILGSPEFQHVSVSIEHIPNSHEGRRFCWQFFGLATGLAIPTTMNMFRKKARLMDRWAKKVGAIVALTG